MRPILIKEDNLITINELKDAMTGEYINDAIITWRLVRKDTGETISSGNFSYVPGSNGKYSAIIDSSVTETLIEGVVYFLEISASSQGRELFRRLNVVALIGGT